ncbi:MAG: hypothetical protein ACQESF_01060 [Nanobdellota archaeon]
MGASTVVTHMILFIAVLGIASGLLIGLKNFSDNAESSFKSQSDAFNNQMKTSFEIEVVHYNNNTETTHIYVRNTGETKHKPEDIDVYIDGIRFPRNETNRTIKIIDDTEVIEKGIWNNKEKILIKAKRKLSDDKTHKVVMTSPYEGKVTDTFSI